MAVTDPETNTFNLAMIDPSNGEPPLQWPPDLDTVYLDLHGRPLPAINVPLDSGEVGYVDALVGIETNSVVGIEIAGYRSLAVVHLSRWGGLTEFIAMSSPAPTGSHKDRPAPSPPGDARRRAVLETVIADTSAMPVYDDANER